MRISDWSSDVCSSDLNSRDVAWLMRAVRAIRPKLIAIGPLKNMTTGDMNEERVAVKVTDMLNRIRAESGAALLVEAHAGHTGRGEEGRWRPRGSSSLLGWPEYGIGLSPKKEGALRTAE